MGTSVNEQLHMLFPRANYQFWGLARLVEFDTISEDGSDHETHTQIAKNIALTVSM